MRRVLLILMIALLPVRGWAADAMAVSMAAQQLHGLGTAAVAAEAADGTNALAKSPMAKDCPMMAMLAGGPVPEANDEAGTQSFKICTTCQLCMGLVTGFSQLHPPLMPLPHTALLLGSVSFTSAERASGFKPPIS